MSRNILEPNDTGDAIAVWLFIASALLGIGAVIFYQLDHPLVATVLGVLAAFGLIIVQIPMGTLFRKRRKDERKEI